MDYYNHSNYPSTSQASYYTSTNNISVPPIPPNASYPYDPRLVPKPISVKPITSIDDNKTDDELWIEAWLSKLGKITINLDYTIKVNSPSTINNKQKKKIYKPPLHVARKVLIRCEKVIENLESAEKLLREHVSTMTSDEWKEKTVEIGCLKDELTALFTQFEGPNSMSALKALVSKRKKKRLAQKRRRTLKRLVCESEKLERTNKHKEINDWLQSMQESIELAKKEELMKKDADCVLSDVHKKKAEAKKHLNLIHSLVKLRTLRELEILRQGEEISLEDKVTFTNITDRLIKMWENCLMNYAKEESALRFTLEQSAKDAKAIELEKEDKLISEWEEVFFGPKATLSPAYLPFVSADTDLETFIAIRKSWDTFLTSSMDKKGTKIPIGWVLPDENASDKWAAFISP